MNLNFKEILHLRDLRKQMSSTELPEDLFRDFLAAQRHLFKTGRSMKDTPSFLDYYYVKSLPAYYSVKDVRLIGKFNNPVLSFTYQGASHFFGFYPGDCFKDKS